MKTLEDLRQMVADLFAAAEDKTTIQKSAIVNQQIDKVAAESTKLSQDYQALLKDYKEVILHTSFKPTDGGRADELTPTANTFNGDDFIATFINTHKSDGSAK